MNDTLPNTLAAWLGYAVLWGSAVCVLAPPFLKWISMSLVSCTYHLVALSNVLAARYIHDVDQTGTEPCPECGRLPQDRYR